METARAWLRPIPEAFGNFAYDHPKTVLAVFGALLLIALVM